ncbi:MAG TPA: carotenoid biosynthesis protein [Actinocrinis sp.]|nr:carotenoid biosynthesis protein [Actinocrinis sp.]
MITAVLAPFAGQRVPLGAFTVLMLVYAVADGSHRYGPRTPATLFVLAVLIGNVVEDLSITTGFPFGTYHHTTGPKLFEVPVTVGPTYFAISYVAWQVAELLVPRSVSRRWIVPAVAAALATMYDLTIDPVASTVVGLWVWPRGGGFFGVPVSNFLGWLVSVFVVLVVFGLSQHRDMPRATRPATGAERHAAPLIYLSLGIAAVSGYLAALRTPDRTVADGSGTQWSVHGVYEGCMVAGLVTVCPAALVALAATRRRSR